jgi:hypothetical protein
MKLVAAVRFLLELGAVVALAVAGARWSWIAAVLAPLTLVVVWGALVAPKATRRLPDPFRLAVEIVVFAACSIVVAIALRVTGDPWEPEPR